MILHPCGCSHERHEPTGALYRVGICAEHAAQRQAPNVLGDAYYQSLGVTRGGRLLPTNHVAEMAEALGSFESPGLNKTALEVGCGASPYVGALRAAGWCYVGVDPSPWVRGFLGRAWQAPCLTSTWEAFRVPAPVGLILAAHVLEHLRDAPAGLAKMAASLDAHGVLYLLVPDDHDPCNPDHDWLFTAESLKLMVEGVGLDVEALAVRRVIERERFVYCKARKP